MPNDKWGHPHKYPTASTAGLTGSGTGFVYEQSDDVTKDQYFNDEGHVSNSGGGTWTMSTSGPDAVQIGKTGTDDPSIGGCDMNFADTETRGYAHSKEDPRDVELTFLVKFVDSSSDNGFAIEGPTGPHSGSGCCSGFAYKFDIQYKPNPTKFRYRKEMYHVSNSDDPKTGEFTDSHFNFQLLGRDEWTGFKYIRYNKKDGVSSGKDSVVLEMWANTDPDNNPENWFLLKKTEDKGGWGDGGDQCNGDKDQIGSWSSQKFRLKSNDEGGEFEFKHLSLREIDPTGTFEEPQPPTGGGTGGGGTDSPQETEGLLTLKYDINVYRTSPCDVGGSSIFYNSPRDGEEATWSFVAETSAGITRTRMGIIAKNSSSTLCNQDPLQEVDWWFKKTGTPTGTLTVRIRNSNNTIKATIGELDVSTLTGTHTEIEFINTSNTYIMVPGDMILAEYSGGDQENYVSMEKRQSLSGDITGSGTNTKAIYYNTFGTDKYVEHTGNEIPGTLWC